MHIQIDYDTIRRMDPTGWLDYVSLTLVILFTLYLLGASGVTIFMSSQKRQDIMIKGSFWLNLMYFGAWLHVVSTFVSDKHMDWLDPLRMLHCTLWDYWGMILGFCFWYLFFSSSLISSILKSMIFVDPNFIEEDDPIHQVLEESQILTGWREPAAADPDRAIEALNNDMHDPADALRAYTPDLDPDRVRYIQNEMDAIDEEILNQTQNLDGWGDSTSPSTSRRDREPSGVLPRVWNWIKSTLGIDTDSRMRVYSEFEGHRYTANVPTTTTSNRTTTSTTRPGDSPIMQADVSCMSEMELMATENMSVDSYLHKQIGLASDIVEGGGCLSDEVRMFRRLLALGWSRLPIRGKFMMLRVICASILVSTAFLVCLFPEVTKDHLVYYNEVEGGCTTVWYYKTLVIGVLGLYLLVIWFLYISLRYGRRIPQFNVRQYHRVLVAMTVILSALIVFNLLAIETFVWGRFLYIALLMALYVYSVHQMIGGSFWDMLRGRTTIDDEISFYLHSDSLPTSFRSMVSNQHYRRVVLSEFLDWVRKDPNIYLIPPIVGLGRGSSSGGYGSGSASAAGRGGNNAPPPSSVIMGNTKVQMVNRHANHALLFDDNELMNMFGSQSLVFPDRLVSLFEKMRHRRELLALLTVKGEEIEICHENFRVISEFFPTHTECTSSDVLASMPEGSVFRDFNHALAQATRSIDAIYNKRMSLPAVPYTRAWREAITAASNTKPTDGALFVDAETFVESMMDMVFWKRFLSDPNTMKKLRAGIQARKNILDASGIDSNRFSSMICCCIPRIRRWGRRVSKASPGVYDDDDDGEGNGIVLNLGDDESGIDAGNDELGSDNPFMLGDDEDDDRLPDPWIFALKVYLWQSLHLFFHFWSCSVLSSM